MNGLLKKGSKGEFVQLMQEMLKKLGYEVSTDGIFGSGTEKIVIQFQKDNNLKQDGLVGSKTWILIQELSSKINKKETPVVIAQFLSETDFENFAKKYNVEIAAIKAVHEVESNGRGFINGKIKILFEGHVFWKELQKRGINPTTVIKGNEPVLHKDYIKNNPLYKLDQHVRLEQAKAINEEAAYASASYGLFQIMGFHFAIFGFNTAKALVEYLSISENNQLEIFGQFLEKNNLLKSLREKKWATFAKGYNGSSYKTNNYDTKIATAYNKYKKMQG